MVISRPFHGIFLFELSIDKTIRCMVLSSNVNDVQTKIADLQEKGWTLAAIADELGVTPNAVEKWKAGDRKPANPKATIAMMCRIVKWKRIPKKRRYKTKSSSSNAS